MRALHGLVQEKCQVTFLKIEIGYSHKIIWTMKTKMNIRMHTNITSPRPPVKEEEPKVNEQSAEKCRWGPDCPFCKNQEKEENKIQQQKMPPQPKVQKPQARRPKTLNLTDRYPSQTKAKQQWEAEMERLNSKYNLNCFSDSELDSESDEGEQYRYEHGYETLI